jgi:HlyD family secretion protein
VGAFLERTGADWVFVVASDGRSAERRRIKVGRRTSEQLEVLSGLATGERVITSDYTGLDRVDRIVLTH